MYFKLYGWFARKGTKQKEVMAMIRTVKDYEKLSEQYNKILEERNSLIDDLPWYKSKVSRLEQRHSKSVDENTRLQNELYTVELNQDEADDKIKMLEREKEVFHRKLMAQLEVNTELRMSNKDKHAILSEISQHIGNKPSSSTYKYFREKLDNLGIGEGE